MHFCALLIVVAAVAANGASLPRALPKANEYQSGDCSGAINFGHHSAFLGDVTMDDTSHSVYLSGHWLLYSGKSGDGGSCNGELVGEGNGGCLNLDNQSKRVKCVKHN